MNSSAENSSPGPKLPKTFRAFVTKFPEIGEAHEKVAQAVGQGWTIGSQDLRTDQDRHLAGCRAGIGREKSRDRTLEHGATTEEIKQPFCLA